MSPSAPVTVNGPRLHGGARRVIGPIPPRDKSGKLMLAPIMGKQVRTNRLGEVVRDDKGQPVEDEVDLRDHREYAAYEHGQKPAEGATKGFQLYQVDLAGEPLVLVYARGDKDAESVFRKEMGITRYGNTDPKVTLVE